MIELQGQLLLQTIVQSILSISDALMPCLTYGVGVGNVSPPEGPVIATPGCRVENLGRAAHSVASAHGSGSHISHPLQLVLSGVIQSVVAPRSSCSHNAVFSIEIAPGIEEHLAVAVQSQVHLDAGLAGEDEVPDGPGLRLREGEGSSVGL